ncbi:MAG: NAD+ synthase [Firmicutes bacterium]|jgi:NAD+ synthase (glutamine-hydrolysing)|nr:NAD+ synthase [Bacillota bacterium]HPU01623.1 NAD+ synthase [Bacillota bacterium]
MLIALAQINPTAGALRPNAARIKEFFHKARQEGADLVVFPEMALTGSPPQDLLLYGSFAAAAEALMEQELAPLTASPAPAMLLGTCRRLQGRLCNAALLLKKGRVEAAYPKAVLEQRAPFQECSYFSRGGQASYERWGELMAAVAVGEGALRPEHRPLLPQPCGTAEEKRLLIIPAASSYRFGGQARREQEAAALAREQRCALLLVNLVGGSDELVFDGASLVYNNRGELIRRAASFAEDLLFIRAGDLFAPAAEACPAAAEDMDTLFQALCLGLKDYFYKSGFSRAVLGLSGGIDSAVTAALAAAALGPKNVLGIMLPSEYSPPHSLEDARALAENLGLETRTIPITPFFHAYLKELNRSGRPEMDLAEENLQARIRGDILMLIANRERRLLLTTGNRSELAVGYCTLYGDMAGALAVLADLPKLTVYELARFINRKHKRAVIPERTITKPPSAELRPDQKDEDSLPPYSVLDPILQLYLDEHLSPEEIMARGFDATTVQRVIALVDRAEYKRRQAAPALRVMSGLEVRRFPVARGRN